MKKLRKVKTGALFQINPNSNNVKYPGFLVAVENMEDVYDWGIQGLLFMDREINVIRFMGQAYIRCKWEDIEYVGQLQWFPKVDLQENLSTLDET